MAVGGFARRQTFCANFNSDAHSFLLARTKASHLIWINVVANRMFKVIACTAAVMRWLSPPPEPEMYTPEGGKTWCMSSSS